jgi:transposase
MSIIKTNNNTKQLLRGISANLFIVIDCAKKEHRANFLDCSTGRFIYKNALKVRNDLDGFNFLVEKTQKILQQKKFKDSKVEVYLEDPCSYSQALIYYLQKQKYLVRYVNALNASHYRDNTRASNDVLDLDGIGRTALMNQFYDLAIQSDLYRRIKESTRERQRLIKDQTRHKNVIHTFIDIFFPDFLNCKKSGVTAFSKGCIELILHKEFSSRLFFKSTPNKVINIIKKTGISEPEKVYLKLKELASKCVDLAKDEPDVFLFRLRRLQEQARFFQARQKCVELEEQQMAQLLQNSPLALCLSITGAGLISIATIAAELGDPRNWFTINQTASYAGVIPKQKQSGGSESAPQVLSVPKDANKHLKNALMTIVGSTKKYPHPAQKYTGKTHPLKQHFDKVEMRGGASVMSTAKKLIRLVYAMVRDENIYMADIKKMTEEHHLIWIEEGTQKLLEKWSKYGVVPTEENYLGKWIQQKKKITQLIKEDFK